MRADIKVLIVTGAVLLGLLVTSLCQAKDLTYESDIKPIFANSCVECHAGSLDYNVVYNQRAKILKKLTNNEMPPKYATGLTDNEKKLVIQWIKAGAKK